MNDITKKRLAKVGKITLKEGAHASLAEGACVMEAVSYVAGEPWSDAPDCACPVLGLFMRRWNDDLRTNEERTRLLAPLVPLLINSRSTPAVESRRSYMALDWLVRTFTHTWLALAGLDGEAAALRALPEMTNKGSETSADVAICAALGAARNAVRSVAGHAPWHAAWVATWHAVPSVAGEAVRSAGGYAVWSAAGDASTDAARVAAWVAARGAAVDASTDAARVAGRVAAAALDPTVITLQASAVELIKRMCEVQS